MAAFLTAKALELVAFVKSTWALVPLFSVLSPQQALRRMVLILAAAVGMIVLLTSIDSAMLYMYVRTARRLPG
jgi:hypothetical protein